MFSRAQRMPGTIAAAALGVAMALLPVGVDIAHAANFSPIKIWHRPVAPRVSLLHEPPTAPVYVPQFLMQFPQQPVAPLYHHDDFSGDGMDDLPQGAGHFVFYPLQIEAPQYPGTPLGGGDFTGDGKADIIGFGR